MPTTTVAGGPKAMSHKRRTTHFYTSNLRKRALCPDPGSAHVYHSPADSPHLPHPLRLFPAPRDHITQMWISKETKKQLSEYERVYPWVDGSEEEGDAGILTPAVDPASRHRPGKKGVAVRDRQACVRRAWRLLTRRHLLDQEPLRPLETLRELRRAKVEPLLPSYVMVRTDVLAEHMHLEAKLRTDRASLREQCTWYFQDKGVSAREALPLMKIAIDEVCDREMSSASSAYSKLQSWVPPRANPLLLKAPLPPQAPSSSSPSSSLMKREAPSSSLSLMKREACHTSSSCTIATSLTGPTFTDHGSSLLAPAPATATSTSTSRTSSGVRSRLLQRVRGLPLNARFGFGLDMLQQLEQEVSAHESEAMGHEEDLCRQAWRFVEARERKEDYGLYYTLAHVFGVLSEQAFQRTHRPGRMYYSAMSNSARGFQRMWRTRWPPRKRRKLRGTIFVQTLFRAYRARRRWRPIVLLRLKYGFRQQLAYRFDRWARITRARSTAHRRFREHQQALQRMVLNAWVRHALHIMRQRKERAEAMALRKTQRWKRSVLKGWEGVTKNHKRIQRNFHRNVEFPYLKWWYDGVQEQKRVKQEKHFALGVQAIGRGYAARRRYHLILQRKALIFNCLRRRIAMTRLAKSQARAHRERVRLATTAAQGRLAKSLVEQEEKRRDALSVELRTADATWRRNMWNSEGEIQMGLLGVRHDFESERPPRFRPADPLRGVTDSYVLADHYETAEPLHAPLHLLLLDADSVLLLFNYVARTVGAGRLLWTLNFWRAVENLRAHRVDSSAMMLGKRPMRARLLQVVRKYLSPHCGNPAAVSPTTADAAEGAAKRLERLGVVTRGLRKAAAYGGVLQQLYAAQFEAFQVLLQEAAGPFFATEEGKGYVKEVEQRRSAMWRKEEGEVKRRHWDGLLVQAREVKQELQRRNKLKQVALETRADLVTAGVTAALCSELLGEACDRYAALHNDLLEETTVTALHKAQDETVRALILEAAAVVALDVRVEQRACHVVDNFVSDMVAELLLDDVTESAMGEYLAVLETLAETAVETAVEGMVGGMVEDGVTEVRTERALLHVQCFFRRRLALKAARRQVAQVLVKCWDVTYQAYYYLNTLTGEASWDKPVILQRLFPLQALRAAAAFSGGDSSSFDHYRTPALPEMEEDHEDGAEAGEGDAPHTGPTVTEGGASRLASRPPTHNTLRRTETFDALPGSSSLLLRPSSSSSSSSSSSGGGSRPSSRGAPSSSSGGSSRHGTPPTPLAGLAEEGGLDGDGPSRSAATRHRPSISIDRRQAQAQGSSGGNSTNPPLPGGGATGGPPAPSEEAKASFRARRRKSSNGQSMRPPTAPSSSFSSRPDAPLAEGQTAQTATQRGTAGGPSTSAIVGGFGPERPPSAGRSGTGASARPPTPDKSPRPERNVHVVEKEREREREKGRAENARPPLQMPAAGKEKNEGEGGGKVLQRGNANGVGRAEAGVDNKAKKNAARAVV